MDSMPCTPSKPLCMSGGCPQRMTQQRCCLGGALSLGVGSDCTQGGPNTRMICICLSSGGCLCLMLLTFITEGWGTPLNNVQAALTPAPTPEPDNPKTLIDFL